MMFHRHRQAGDRRSPQIRRFASCLTALFLGVVATVQAFPAASGDASSGGLARSDSTTALLVVCGLGGRLVREVAPDRVVLQGMRWIWDGCDNNGTAVPAGLYLVRVRGTGNALCAKVLRLR